MRQGGRADCLPEALGLGHPLDRVGDRRQALVAMAVPVLAVLLPVGHLLVPLVAVHSDLVGLVGPGHGTLPTVQTWDGALRHVVPAVLGGRLREVPVVRQAVHLQEHQVQRQQIAGPQPVRNQGTWLRPLG
jgi:hypothetical protein